MDWGEYEKITKYIYETLGKSAGVKIDGYGSNCKVKGKSGVDHQIDVLASHSDGVHTYKTAIECKFWEKSINKDIVMKVAEIVEDAGINKGVIVSKKGFTEDGISFAGYKNIGLVELREIEEKDKTEFDLGILSIKTELRRPEVLEVIIDNVGKNQKPEHINTRRLKVRLKDGEEVPLDNYLTSFKDELHRGEPEKVVQKYYELVDAHLINEVTKTTTQVKGLLLRGRLTVKNTNLKWHIVDEVWLIMKSLFEAKSFTISRSGLIKEGKHIQK